MVIPPMGPLPPPVPRDPTPTDVEPPNERDQDPARGAYVDALTNQPSHPLTDEEEEAAQFDPGRPERTYAPASERVPKEPIPGDAELLEDEAGRSRAEEDQAPR